MNKYIFTNVKNNKIGKGNVQKISNNNQLNGLWYNVCWSRIFTTNIDQTSIGKFTIKLLSMKVFKIIIFTFGNFI